MIYILNLNPHISEIKLAKTIAYHFDQSFQFLFHSFQHICFPVFKKILQPSGSPLSSSLSRPVKGCGDIHGQIRLLTFS